VSDELREALERSQTALAAEVPNPKLQIPKKLQIPMAVAVLVARRGLFNTEAAENSENRIGNRGLTNDWPIYAGISSLSSGNHMRR